MILPLAKVPGIIAALAVIWVIVMILLSLIILVQKGKGGGLGAALGGMGAGSLLGTKTGDFLTWVTIAFTVIFLVLAVVLAKFYKPMVIDDLKSDTAAVQVDNATSATLETLEVAEITEATATPETTEVPAAEPLTTDGQK